MGGGDDFSLAVCFGEEDEVGCGCGGGDLNVRRWWVGALEGRSAGLKWKLGHAGLFLFSFSFSFSFCLLSRSKFMWLPLAMLKSSFQIACYFLLD
jgi:hypothetical protein